MVSVVVPSNTYGSHDPHRIERSREVNYSLSGKIIIESSQAGDAAFPAFAKGNAGFGVHLLVVQGRLEHGFHDQAKS